MTISDKASRSADAASKRPLGRYAAVVLHDFGCAAFSYWFAAALILPLHRFAADLGALLPAAFAAAAGSALISHALGVFSSRWRLASLTDFVALIKSAACLTLALVVVRALAHVFHPEPFFVAELRVICLGGLFALGSQAGGRIGYRYYRFLRRQAQPGASAEATLVVGSISEAESALRAAEQGILKANIVACLLPRGSRISKQVRGCAILGTTDQLEDAVDRLGAGGIAPTSLLLAPGALAKREEAQELKRAARRIGLTLLKLETVGIGGRSEIRFEDFLFRNRRRIDHRAIASFVSGATVLITGGGGTIGGDIALRAAAHGARKIVLLDLSELGLQTRRAQLQREYPSCEVRSVICNVRDAKRLTDLVSELRPDILIHAAALKHVDLVEENWQEAALTNVIGTLNALDAADEASVPTMVNISTDKAADPVGMLGFTKRAGEKLVAARSVQSPNRRFSVRFGNVLGSSGSVLEVFLAQIAAGGPLTITDPRVTRYFMSRDEAAELVLAAGSLADGAALYLLDMGDPISINDLAVELIEWAGLTPEKDIRIVHTGLRPGERVTEQLTGEGESLKETTIHGIKAVTSQGDGLRLNVGDLRRAVERNDKRLALRALQGDLAPATYEAPRRAGGLS